VLTIRILKGVKILLNLLVAIIVYDDRLALPVKLTYS